MSITMAFWIILPLLIVALSLPPALSSKSWKRFFVSMVLSATGIVIPLFIFVMSMFLIPDWKGACKYGWLDCFHTGKLALTPFVLWACAAFHVVQIQRKTGKNRLWVNLGLFIGSIVSTACLIYGLVIHKLHDPTTLWLLVPLYVSIWYSVLNIRAMRTSGVSAGPYIITLLSSVPFWVIGVYWSKKTYLSLPDTPPDCFVVTAALRGHAPLVGPFFKIERRGRSRVANQQLITFWHFEQSWRAWFPKSHRVFRWFYNRIGPRVARAINKKLKADLIYVFLKPFEILAAPFVYFRIGKKAERIQR
jgi:hypothetical protein